MRPRSRLSASSGLTTGANVPGTAATTTAGRLAAQARLPPRSTKVTEKLVLLPETDADELAKEEEDERAGGGAGRDGAEDDELAAAAVDEELVQKLAQERNLDPVTLRQRLALAAQQRLHGDFGVDNDLAPLLAEEEALRQRFVSPEKAKSYAERLPKARRAEKLPRVTAYCTAQGFKMGATAAFVKEWHGARTKLYDDCLYMAYHLPLLSGRGGYRIRSSPVLKDVGGKIVLDEEIARNERRDYHEEYDVEEHEHSVGGRGDNPHGDEVGGHHEDEQQQQRHTDNSSESDRPSTGEEQDESSADSTHHKAQPVVRRISPNVFNYAEMFVFSYGVVVFWNCTERQEKDILADLTFSSSVTTAGPPISLATLPLPEEDFETEEFHFEYSTQISRPRVYNDMITLRSGDHMIKLAISHGIAQSTKLCFFEEAMSKEMTEAKDIPRRLAMTGKLGMKRDEVFRILGRLFKSRVEVNLCMSPLFFFL
jgi:uncharacterized Rmd1/YagE family protein